MTPHQESEQQTFPLIVPSGIEIRDSLFADMNGLKPLIVPSGIEISIVKVDAPSGEGL